MNRIELRHVTVISAVALTAVTVACSDWSPTESRGVQPTSDVVAEGMMHNALWVPSNTGMQLSAQVRAPIEIRLGAGVSTQTGAAVSEWSASRSFRLGLIGSANGATVLLPIAPPGDPRGLPRLSMRARNILRSSIDGKRIALSVVGDGKRFERKPPKAIVLMVNNRVVTVTELTWAKKAGVWRPLLSRTTGLDSVGRVAFVLESDASDLTYAHRTRQLGARLRQHVKSAIPSVVNLALPDVLYAESAAASEEACGPEKAGLQARPPFERQRVGGHRTLQ